GLAAPVETEQHVPLVVERKFHVGRDVSEPLDLEPRELEHQGLAAAAYPRAAAGQLRAISDVCCPTGFKVTTCDAGTAATCDYGGGFPLPASPQGPCADGNRQGIPVTPGDGRCRACSCPFAPASRI